MKLKEKKLSHLDIKPCNILIKKLEQNENDENNLKRFSAKFLSFFNFKRNVKN